MAKFVVSLKKQEEDFEIEGEGVLVGKAFVEIRDKEANTVFVAPTQDVIYIKKQGG